MTSNREIVESFNKEIDYLRNNIVINECDICHKLYRQKWTSNICNDCEKIVNVF